jgi:hypothetical protein
MTHKIVREPHAVDTAEHLVSLVVRGLHLGSTEKKGSRGTQAQERAKKIKVHPPVQQELTYRWMIPVEVEGDSFVVIISKV